MIWPVIHPEASASRNSAIAAMSSTVPMRFKGCLSAIAARFWSLASNRSARGVSVNEGATQLTRILGASSAARERVNPSTAPLAAATDACMGSPWRTATVLKVTIEEVPAAFIAASEA